MQHRTLRRCAAAGVAGALALSTTLAGAAPSPQKRAAAATRYIASHQERNGSISGGFSRLGTTADALVAFVAAERGERQVERAENWLRRNVADATTLGLKAKVVIAAAASWENPRKFGGRNLVEEIAATLTDEGRYGGESDTEVGYHAFAMIALKAAGENVPNAAVKWLHDAQCGDGGWQFDEPAGPNDDEHCRDSTAENDFAGSDTNTTALAVIALAGEQDPAGDPFAFFDGARDPYKGGWVYDPSGKCTDEALAAGDFCYLTDTNSTSLVTMAYQAHSRAVPQEAFDALGALQYRLCGKRMGAFAFTWTYDRESERFRKDAPNLGATVAAVPALVGFELGSANEVLRPPPPRRRCA